VEATEALQCISTAFIKKIPKPYKVEGRERVTHGCRVCVLSLVRCWLVPIYPFIVCGGELFCRSHIKQEDSKYVLIDRMPL